jgi:hypothetical protein
MAIDLYDYLSGKKEGGLIIGIVSLIIGIGLLWLTKFLPNIIWIIVGALGIILYMVGLIFLFYGEFL